eukprot:TRINITY_DN15968_c0_g1_i1.p1 TRINITY_DN15968_c0_g1~~TRINITY_DN15968_c0_g1_i1.p1  ORF type:complete len:64 (-),score=0.18 TRINITY_DN15968_c0_g1_i1:161-352(-)
MYTSATHSQTKSKAFCGNGFTQNNCVLGNTVKRAYKLPNPFEAVKIPSGTNSISFSVTVSFYG